MTIRLAFVVPSSPALTEVTDTFAIAIPGQDAGLAITGSRLISTLMKSGFASCCELITLTGQVLTDKLMSALKRLVDTVLGPLISAGDAARGMLSCFKNPDIEGCAANAKKTGDLIGSLVNDGGGIDYAGAVTLALSTATKEVGRYFVNQLFGMIERQITHLVEIFVKSMRGCCTSSSTRPPSTVHVNAATALRLPVSSLRLQLTAPQPAPGAALPPNLHAKKPMGVLVAPALKTWPKFAAVGGALAVTLGAGWFFFGKARRA